MLLINSEVQAEPVVVLLHDERFVQPLAAALCGEHNLCAAEMNTTAQKADQRTGKRTP